MDVRTTLLCLALGFSSVAFAQTDAKSCCQANKTEHLKSLNKDGFDSSYSPKDDFYHYVNKGWMDSHPLTGEYSRYGQFNILNDSSNNRVRRIVTGLAAKNPQKGTNAYKIANLYEMGLDSVSCGWRFQPSTSLPRSRILSQAPFFR